MTIRQSNCHKINHSPTLFVSGDHPSTLPKAISPRTRHSYMTHFRYGTWMEWSHLINLYFFPPNRMPLTSSPTSLPSFRVLITGTGKGLNLKSGTTLKRMELQINFATLVYDPCLFSKSIDLHVYTGTYGILKLRDASGSYKRISLHKDYDDRYMLYAPKYFWKVSWKKCLFKNQSNLSENG